VRRYRPEVDPVGQRLVTLRLGDDAEGPELTIVGVVPDTHVRSPEDLGYAPDASIFVPLAQQPPLGAWIVVRVSGDPLSIADSVRGVVAAVDDDQPVNDVSSLRQAIVARSGTVTVFGTFFVVFGTVALLMAAVGIYGVMSFAAGQRTREVGIRVALGAAPSSVAGLILRQGMRRVGIGLAFGVPLAIGLGQLLASGLLDVHPADPVMLISIVAVLLVTGAVATWIPARRTSRVDPLETMRAE